MKDHKSENYTKFDDEVEETPAERDQFWSENEELLGLLLSMDEKLSNSGSLVLVVSLLVYIAIVIIVSFGLGEKHGYDLEIYNSWAFYVSGFIGLFVIAAKISSFQEKLVYRGLKSKIYRILYEDCDSMSRYRLISKIERSPDLSLSNILKHLKTDED